MAKSTKTKTVKKSATSFTPSFRMRCAVSFGKAVSHLHIASSLNRSPENSVVEVGLNYMSCYTDLSHSIEMLSKATLEKHSRYLLLDGIALMDILTSKESAIKSNHHACGGYVALARASKFFKKKATDEDLNRLNNIMKARNNIIHNDFQIADLLREKHVLTAGLIIVRGIFDKQFRGVGLLKEAEKFIDDDVTTTFKQLESENSDEFKDVEREASENRKAGVHFTTCQNCYYPFAKLSNDENIYQCLWCDDERAKVTCAANGCHREFWQDSQTPPHFVAIPIIA